MFDQHTVCTKCRPTKCTFDSRCSECSSWSDDFMHVFIKHCQSLVAKRKKKQGVAGLPLSSSASFCQTNVPVSSSLSQDVHLVRELMPPSANLGLTSSFAAPSSVPHSVATVVGPTEGERQAGPMKGVSVVPGCTVQTCFGSTPKCVSLFL